MIVDRISDVGTGLSALRGGGGEEGELARGKAMDKVLRGETGSAGGGT